MGAWRRILGVARRTAEGTDPLPDADLLARFAATRDQAAFELLVWRHAAMVIGVCRRAVRDEHLAEDAFQAVFLVLARKAGAVGGSNLAGWLFRVARRVALRTARRISSTQPLAVEPAGSPLPDRLEQAELRTLLDDEIARLPERFRLPVLLCYLGGQSTDDAAKVLGVPRGTILSRLSTARTRLAARLTRRGITVPAVAVAVTPAAVVNATVRSSLAFASRSTALSTIPATLAEGVLRTMTVTKLIPAAALVVVTGLASGFGIRPGPGVVPAVAQQPEKKSALSQPQPPKDSAGDRAAERDLQLTKYRKLAANLLAQIEEEERAIEHKRQVLAANGDARATARLQQHLAALESDLFAGEKELLELQVRRDLMKQKLAATTFPAPEVEAGDVEKDHRVRDIAAQVEQSQQMLNASKVKLAAAHPTTLELEKQVADMKARLADVRREVRDGLRSKLQVEARKAQQAKLDDTEERLTLAERVMTARKKTRDDLEKSLTTRQAKIVDVEPMVEALKPKKELLAKLHAQIAQFEIGDALPVAQPSGVEAKLDRLLSVVEELRKEVRELKKR